MEKAENQNSDCTSILKDGTNKTSEAVFTKVWLDMINHIEENKNRILDHSGSFLR